MPKALGGAQDGYTNPEQLFAAGYSSCFDSALNLVIKTAKISAGITTVSAEVSIGPNETGGFGLAVKLAANIPGVDQLQAEELVAKAHQICPYSNATRGNIEVQLSVSNND
ncbi:Organic hydroperoxide resistance protein OhrB [compost metagenome]